VNTRTRNLTFAHPGNVSGPIHVHVLFENDSSRKKDVRVYATNQERAGRKPTTTTIVPLPTEEFLIRLGIQGVYSKECGRRIPSQRNAGVTRDSILLKLSGETNKSIPRTETIRVERIRGD